MDLLNKAYTQLAELFRAMTIQARITTVVLLVAIGVSLFFLFQYQTSSADEFIFGGRDFSQEEIARMEAAFAKAGLSKSQIEGNKIKVPRNEKNAYIAALGDASALPADASSYIDDALQSSPFESQAQREARLKHAKQQQLSQVISEMQGIERAVVTFEKEVRPGFRKDVDIRAVAAVKAANNAELDDRQIRAIRQTVTAYVAGLKKESVTITDMNAGVAYPGASESGMPTAGDNIYAQQKKYYEDFWLEKVQRAVSMIPGVVVGVDVVLSPEMNMEERKVAVDTKPTALVTGSTSKSTTNRNTPEGGRVGVVPNGGAGLSNTAQSVGSGAGSESTLEESSEHQQSVAGKTQTFTEKAGLVPEQVRVSIQIPVEYYAQIWKQRNPPKEGEPAADPPPQDLAAIEAETKLTVQKNVVQLLPPIPTDQDKYPLVEVASFVKLNQEVLPEPGMTADAMSWLANNWHMLAGIGIALFGMILLRSFVAGGLSAPPSPEEVPQLARRDGDDSEEELSEEAEAAVNVLRNRFKSHGPSLRDDLGELVREDPDAAAMVLRSWIGDAA